LKLCSEKKDVIIKVTAEAMAIRLIASPRLIFLFIFNHNFQCRIEQ